MKKGLIKSSIFIFPILVIIISLAIGSYHMSPIVIFKIIVGKIFGINFGIDELTINLFFTTRLPRVIAGAIIGAGLALSGAVFQSIFKNPLASPYTLGISNGAGFGAAMGILIGLSTFGVQIFSIIFSIVSIAITFILAIKSRNKMTTLILSGMLVSSFFSSLIAFIKYVADPFEKLPQIVYWLMGSLASSDFEKIFMILPIYLLTLVIIYLYRWKINIISMGDVEARSYGVNVTLDRSIIIISASILTAIVVSISGIIGWVGVVIPHIVRMIVGADFRKIYSLSLSFGIIYMLFIDDICKVISNVEIPIGVVTGIVGVPVFIYFIFRKKVRW